MMLLTTGACATPTTDGSDEPSKSASSLSKQRSADECESVCAIMVMVPMLELRDVTSQPISISPDDKQNVEIVLVADDGTRKSHHILCNGSDTLHCLVQDLDPRLETVKLEVAVPGYKTETFTLDVHYEPPSDPCCPSDVIHTFTPGSVSLTPIEG